MNQKLNKKKCIICSLTFPNFKLDVDGIIIPFIGESNKDYFANHYSKLGYEIIQNNKKINISNMKLQEHGYAIGDILTIKNSFGYYREYTGRFSPLTLLVSEKDDEFPINKAVTVIGFQKLGPHNCLIVRYGKRAYWISISMLNVHNLRGKTPTVTLIEKTNARKTKDILKRYWHIIV